MWEFVVWAIYGRRPAKVFVSLTEAEAFAADLNREAKANLYTVLQQPKGLGLSNG